MQGAHYHFRADGVRIAMISSQSRIGTTTMALGFAAWLGSVGASVAYVEKNTSGIIPYLSDAYEMDEEAGGYRLEKCGMEHRHPIQGFTFCLRTMEQADKKQMQIFCFLSVVQSLMRLCIL